MKLSLFYHSLVSDWNHGNAHFLRGVTRELLERGHEVAVYEPADAWSKENLVRDHGLAPLAAFREVYPQLESRTYDRSLSLEQVAAESDVVLVHEWNEPWVVNGFGELRRRGTKPFTLLFHDTHHRAVSDPSWLRRFELEHYDGVLAFGEVLTDIYRRHGWSSNVWTWHEAADTRVFYPREPSSNHPSGDLVWIGNWGDDERARELEEFLFQPVRTLKLHAHVFGVRYPREVLSQLDLDGLHYGGWLANFRAPEVFANHRVTVHVPRRYYVQSLPGIPTIRPFEAMACGIPLVSAPWHDSEGLFTAGDDFLIARDGDAMRAQLRAVLADGDLAAALTSHALNTIRQRHTCGHRVEQLLDILSELQQDSRPAEAIFDRAGRGIHATG